jgi:putative PEP-CTERM system TPR-repeat lipoprotein
MREALRLSGPQNIDAGIVLGMTHLQLKQVDAATAVFNDMQKRSPDNALVYNLLGGARLGARDRAGARAAFEKSAALKADFFTPVQNLGRMDVSDNKPDAARQRYQAFVERHPGNADALVALAELAVARNQNAEAIGWLEKAVAANPKLPGPGMRLTQLYLKTGDKRKALTQIRTMQVADPENPALLDMLGSVQAANGDKAAALEAYQRLAAIQPRTTTMAARLSAAYDALGERDLAADVLRKATADYPEDMSLLLARAAMETRRGNHEQAVMLAREAQKRPGAQVAGLVAEAEIREAQRKPELAIAPYQKAVELDKAATPLRIKLANAYRLAGRPDDAIKLVQQWRAQRPEDNALGVYLGELYLGQKKFPAAIETLNALLKRVPDNGIVLNNLALAYQGAGDPRALGAAEQAYKVLPQSPAVMDTLGWLLVEKGELARGVGLLKQASAAEPGAGDIRYHLAAALARNNERSAARKEIETLLSNKGDVAQAEQARALLKQL